MELDFSTLLGAVALYSNNSHSSVAFMIVTRAICFVSLILPVSCCLDCFLFDAVALGEGPVAAELSAEAIKDLKEHGVTFFKVDNCLVPRGSIGISLKETDFSSEGTRLLATLPNIRLLNAAGIRINKSSMRLIASCKNLVALDMAGVRSKDEELLWGVCDLSQLKCLDLSAAGIDDTFLAQLVSSPASQNLSLVNLSGNRVTSKGVLSLAQIRTLQSVDLSYTLVEAYDLREMRALPKLTRLSIDGIGCESGLGFLGDLAQLRSLQANLTLSPRGAKPITTFGNRPLPAGLEQLAVSINGWNLGRRDLRLICNLPRLAQLGLNGFNVQLGARLDSSRLQNINILDLSDSTFNDDNLDSLDKLVGVKQLNLSSTGINGDCLESISALSHLKLLDVSNTHISNSTLEKIAQSTSIQNLNLQGARQLTARGIKHLQDLRSLKTLKLAHQDLRGDGLGCLASVSGLHDLEMSQCILDLDTLDSLRRLTQLQALTLSNCRVPDGALGSMDASHLSFLASLDGLESLTLNGVVQTSDSDPVAQLPNLRYLHGWKPLIPEEYLSKTKLRYLSINAVSPEAYERFEKNFPHAILSMMVYTPMQLTVEEAAKARLNNLLLVQTRDVLSDEKSSVQNGREVLHCFAGQELLGNTEALDCSPQQEESWSKRKKPFAGFCCNTDPGSRFRNIEIRAYVSRGESFQFIGRVFPDPCVGNCPPNVRPFAIPWSAGVHQLNRDISHPSYFKAIAFASWFEEQRKTTWPADDDTILSWSKSLDPLISEFAIELLLLRCDFETSSEVFRKLSDESKQIARQKIADLGITRNGD